MSKKKTNELTGRDCQPLQGLDGEWRKWLEELAAAAATGIELLRLGDAPSDDDTPVVMCEADGRWHCGRYVGTISFKGRQLHIHPRFGLETLGEWLSHAIGIRLTDTPGEVGNHQAFLPFVLAHLWSAALAAAARHGPPAFRVEHNHHGAVARGRVDIRRTIEWRARGREGVASTMRVRSFDHVLSHIIIAAFTALRSRLGKPALTRLMSDAARDLIDRLTMVVPLSVPPPSDTDVARIRFTPITAVYKPLVKLSLAIARKRGLFVDANPEGNATGVLLDMAELWELFVVSSLKSAMPSAKVSHGTREDAGRGHLLVNRDGRELAYLLPDVLVETRSGPVVMDAKYKSLSQTRARPYGVAREDMYQMAAYLSYWRASRGTGFLIYPRDGDPNPFATANGPWSFANGDSLQFVALPTTSEGAAHAFRELLADDTSRIVEDGDASSTSVL